MGDVVNLDDYRKPRVSDFFVRWMLESFRLEPWVNGYGEKVTFAPLDVPLPSDSEPA